jgi:hypothetical protein
LIAPLVEVRGPSAVQRCRASLIIITSLVRDLQIFDELKVIQLVVAARFLMLAIDPGGGKFCLFRAGRRTSANFVRIPKVWLFARQAYRSF